MTTATRQSLPLSDLAACCNPVTGTVLDAAAAERLDLVLDHGRHLGRFHPAELVHGKAKNAVDEVEAEPA